MSKPLSASRLFRLGRTRSGPSAPDPADLGTAFGLELSLMDQRDELPGASAEARASATGAGWWRRLTLRGRADA